MEYEAVRSEIARHKKFQARFLEGPLDAEGRGKVVKRAHLVVQSLNLPCGAVVDHGHDTDFA